MTVNVTYNTAPRRPSGQTGVHWLITLVEGIRNIATKDMSIRVSREIRDNYIVYTIRRSANKTKLFMYAQGNEIFIETYSLKLPDVTQIYRPRYGDFEGHGCFVMTSAGDGFLQAINYCIAHLEKETPYESGNYEKIKISTNPQLVDYKTIFFGGKIVSAEYCDDQLETTIVVQGQSGKPVERKQPFLSYGALSGAQGTKHFVSKKERESDVRDTFYVQNNCVDLFYAQV